MLIRRLIVVGVLVAVLLGGVVAPSPAAPDLGAGKAKLQWFPNEFNAQYGPWQFNGMFRLGDRVFRGQVLSGSIRYAMNPEGPVIVGPGPFPIYGNANGHTLSGSCDPGVAIPFMDYYRLKCWAAIDGGPGQWFVILAVVPLLSPSPGRYPTWTYEGVYVVNGP